jgi:hypothetical protein
MKFSFSYLSAALFAGAAGAVSTLAVAQTEPQVPARSAVDVDLSLILDGVYYNRISRGNENPAGFGGSHGHFHDHDHGHSHGFDEGFNMGHSEIAMNARLGDVLDGTLIIGFNEDDFELEEAFLTTRALPAGLQLKGGKFLSDIGYINSRHPHDWDFVDRPLVNEYLFGDHGLREKGVQISWVPATEQYTRGLRLVSARVPLANLLGEPGDQVWYVFEVVAPYFLTAMAGTYLGIAQAAVDAAGEHLRMRQYAHSGESLRDVETLRVRFAEMWIALEKTRGLVQRAAQLGDAGSPDALSFILASKADAGETAVNLANEAMTLCGGFAYRANSRVAQLLRDARASHVMAPTTDILKSWAGRHLLGLPLL